MGISIAGCQRNRLPVSGNRLIRPLQLVQHVAQVKKRQHVGRVDLRRAAVKLLGTAKLAKMEVNCTQVDPGRRKAGWRGSSRPPPRPALPPGTSPARLAERPPQACATATVQN